jgi:hypothetical protein
MKNLPSMKFIRLASLSTRRKGTLIRRLLPLRNRRTRKRRYLQARETRRGKCLRPAKLKIMVTVFCALQPF